MRRSLPLALFALLSGCDDAASPHGRDTYPGAEWVVSTPAREGLDPVALDAVRAYAFDDPERYTAGVVVVRHGVVVGEWYGDAIDATVDATSWSVAKTFASVLVGIAIDRGEVDSVDAPMSTFFPTWAEGPNAAITLRDVLEMRSGLPWDQDGYSDLALVLSKPDQLLYARDRVANTTPGTVWHYSSGDSMLLAGVLEAATARDVGAYAEDHLFGPIGMTPTFWRDQAGHALTYCCLDAEPRDFARFGLLLARGGRWEGRQVISKAYLDAATTPIPEKPTYGLQFWMLPGHFEVDGVQARVLYADGRDTQRIYAVPELDLVVVRTGVYEHIGETYVWGSGSFILTTAPQSWDDRAFIQRAIQAIDPDAEFVPTP